MLKLFSITPNKRKSCERDKGHKSKKLTKG